MTNFHTLQWASCFVQNWCFQVTKGRIEEREKKEKTSAPSRTPHLVWLGNPQSTDTHHFFFSPLPPFPLPISFLPVKPTGDALLTRACVWVLPEDFILNMSGGRRQLGAEQLRHEQSWLIRFLAASFLHAPPYQSAALSHPLLDFIPLVVLVNLQISFRSTPASTLIKGISPRADNVRNN